MEHSKMLLLLLLLLLGSSLATHDANETSAAAASDRGRGGNRQGKSEKKCNNFAYKHVPTTLSLFL